MINTSLGLRGVRSRAAIRTYRTHAHAALLVGDGGVGGGGGISLYYTTARFWIEGVFLPLSLCSI